VLRGRTRGSVIQRQLFNNHDDEIENSLLYRCHDDLEHGRIRRRRAAEHIRNNTIRLRPPSRTPGNSLSIHLLRRRSVQPRKLFPKELSSTFVIQLLTVKVGEILRDLRFRVHDLLTKDVVLVQEQDLCRASWNERCLKLGPRGGETEGSTDSRYSSW
jgi:hypothetical protein